MASSLLMRGRLSFSSGESHVCHMCCKKFLSRRALNGHMRVHGGHGSAESNNSKAFSESSLLRNCWRSEAPSMEEEEAEYYDVQEEEPVSQPEKDSELEPEGGRLDLCGLKKLDSSSRGTPFGDRSNMQNGERASLVRAVHENPRGNALLTDKDHVLTQEQDHSSSPYTCNVIMCSKTFGTHTGLLQHMQLHAEKVPLPGHASKMSIAADMSNKGSSNTCVEHDGRMLCTIWRTSTHSNEPVRKVAADAEHDPMCVVQQSFPISVSKSSYDAASVSKSIPTSLNTEDQHSRSTFATNCALREVEAAITLIMLSEGLTDSVKTSTSVVPQRGSMHKIKKPNKSSGTDNFECQVCGKRFGSYQALGGHTAMHMKLDRMRTPYGSAVECRNMEERHECGLCHRVFPTGQALGGHMRRHWTSD